MLVFQVYDCRIVDSASGSEGEGSPDHHKRSKFEDVSDKESETESVPMSGEVWIIFLHSHTGKPVSWLLHLKQYCGDRKMFLALFLRFYIFCLLNFAATLCRSLLLAINVRNKNRKR